MTGVCSKKISANVYTVKIVVGMTHIHSEPEKNVAVYC